MQITKLSSQRNGSRLNVYLDNKFAFGVGVFVASKNKLSVGEDYSKEDLKQVYIEDVYEYLKTRILAYLSTRPRSKKEVKLKIKQVLKGVNEQNLSNQNQHSVLYSYLLLTSKEQKVLEEQVTEFLEKYNYINDYAFAKWVCEQRLNQGKGAYYINQDLQKKGVEKSIIKEVLQTLDSKEALNSSFKRALKKYEKEKDTYKKKQKIYRFLLTKGFSYDQINNLEF